MLILVVMDALADPSVITQIEQCRSICTDQPCSAVRTIIPDNPLAMISPAPRLPHQLSPHLPQP